MPIFKLIRGSREVIVRGKGAELVDEDGTVCEKKTEEDNGIFFVRRRGAQPLASIKYIYDNVILYHRLDWEKEGTAQIHFSSGDYYIGDAGRFRYLQGDPLEIVSRRPILGLEVLGREFRWSR